MSNELNKEILNIKTASERLSVSHTKELLKAYKNSLDSIRQHIANISLKYSVDGKLNVSSQQRYTILSELEKQLVQQVQHLGNQGVKITTKTLTDVYEETYYRTAYEIDRGSLITTDFSILRPEFIKAAVNTPTEGKTFSSRIWSNAEKLASRVKQDVEKALVQGASPEKLARHIKSDFGSSAYQAKRLINTEVAKCVSAAQDEIYQNSDVVEQVMWDATLDNLTADEDADLDGQTWDKHELHPIPPLHPNCRCCLIPVVSGWKPTKKLKNIEDKDGNKTIIDYTSYNKWKESLAIN